METLEQRIQRVIREEVALASYDPAWPESFQRERDQLLSCFPGPLIRRIDHIGSTAVPGLAVVGFVTHEGRRMVLPDNSIATPGWTRIDLGARWTQRLVDGQTLVWRLGVDNLADRRAWQEAPYQFGHAYLYPLAPRTLHASLAAAW